MLCWGCRLGMWSLWRTPGTGTRGGTPCTTLSRQVLDQGAGYVLAPRGNQESLNDDVRLFLDDPATPVAQASQTNKGHGRIEIRRASVSDDVAWLQEIHQWPGLAAVGKITASRQVGDHTSVESRYYLLSQAFPPERFNAIVREHWGDRKPAALDAGCGIQRGPVQKPKGSPSGKPVSDAETGPQSGPNGTIEGVHEGQAQTRRLGQWLSRHHPIPVHQNSNAIALERLLTAIDIPK